MPLTQDFLQRQRNMSQKIAEYRKANKGKMVSRPINVVLGDIEVQSAESTKGVTIPSAPTFPLL